MVNWRATVPEPGQNLWSNISIAGAMHCINIASYLMVEVESDLLLPHSGHPGWQAVAEHHTVVDLQKGRDQARLQQMPHKESTQQTPHSVVCRM
jgi:hypothetical protein